MDELTPSEQGELEVLSRMPLTDAGQARLEALRQKAGQSPPADELASLRQQLATAQAERDRLRAALERIGENGPETCPPEPSLGIRTEREAHIAISYLNHGKEISAWMRADIARTALEGGDVANGAGKEDSR